MNQLNQHFTASFEHLLFFDDFTDGDASGDHHWESISGRWKVSAGKALFSHYKRNNRTVVDSAFLGDIGSCFIEMKIKLTKRARRNPNAAILFNYQDIKNYRYIRLLKKGWRKKLLIGQVAILVVEGVGKFLLEGRVDLVEGARQHLCQSDCLAAARLCPQLRSRNP